MYNWGQTPFAHAKESDYRITIHVQKGSVPNCIIFQIQWFGLRGCGR